ncbi:MAG: radical SAM protein [Candidatus Hecatellales archaeon]|nr:MAG: radical SAM protein [Candidatus Hecatellales archaeon]
MEAKLTGKVEYSYVTCKSALSKSRLPELDYALNPYVGCEHGCLYCYSRSILKDEKMALRWGSFVWAKKNIVERLRKDLRRKKAGVIGVGTITDPYQPLESKLRLTRGCLEFLSVYRFPVSIQTKSNLILRDLDLIKPEKFDVGVTITTIDKNLAKKLEPKAPNPDARIQVVEELADKKVETWIFLGPVIPYVNDDRGNLEAIIEVAKKTGSKILYDRLNLKRWVLESLKPFLEKEKPGLSDVLPRVLGFGSDYWVRVSEVIRGICGEKGVKCEPAFPYV